MILNTLEFAKSFCWRILTWATQPKNIIFTTGRLFFVIGFGGGVLFDNFVIKHFYDNGAKTEISFTTDQLPILIQNSLWFFGFLGALILIYEVCSSIIVRNKISIIGVEHIGLRKRIATPLSACLRRAEIIPIDLSCFYENDKLLHPKKALELTIAMIENILKSKATEIGSKEVNIIYGGTAPVGFGFFAGYLMSNTYHVEVWDYNRNAKNGKNWYKVDGFSDANKPIIIEDNYTKEKDICILMSISYPVTIEQVREKVSYLSYIEIMMPVIKYDNMSSIEKLTDFENKFGELLKRLAADGTERVHVFCAAQSSFNFSMGRQVTRNHPAIIVYEYDISHPEKYPWGIVFNTKDNTSPAVI